LEERRLRGDTEKEVLSSSPWDPEIRRVGMAQSCARGGLDWTLGSISLPRGWVKHWNRLLREVANAPSLSVFKRLWTTPLTTRFNLVSPALVRQLD